MTLDKYADLYSTDPPEMASPELMPPSRLLLLLIGVLGVSVQVNSSLATSVKTNNIIAVIN